MNSLIRDEFESRILEVDKYFDFIERIDNGYQLLNDFEKETFIIDDDLLKILKANSFLILYNLIESTILNCIVGIFDEIKTENLSYKDVTQSIKIYWSKNIYRFDEKIKEDRLIREKFYNIVERIISDIALEISDRIEYGGSIDAKKIHKIAKDLEIVFPLNHYKENLHGKVFSDIKKNRNDLAHGKKSFSDIGKNVTYTGNEMIKQLGLKHFKNYTIEHLGVFISSVEKYLINKSYKNIG
ncbi:MAG: MAE_28990/MAE_18760 family HEPN-like nuclease [Polaribacter sp.]